MVNSVIERNKIKNTVIACKIADKILKKLFNILKQNKKKEIFKTELDIFNFLKKETYKNNCRLAFKPVVAMQENAAEIHHKPNNTKLKRGFLVIDFGVKYKGYHSDCSRTAYLGKPTFKEKYFYRLVLNSQLTALNHVKIGVYAADIDLIARGVLWKYFKNFVHSTGHGVGKKIHMSPKISPNSKSILRENMIITIEPGLYFKNKFGIRIEDTLIVKNKPVVLTKITKELITF